MDNVAGNGSSLDERMRVRQPTGFTERPGLGSSLRGDNDRGCYGPGHISFCDSLNSQFVPVVYMGKFSRCLVGGTFDRFHSGHLALINSALEVAEYVEVWISSDNMAAIKSPFIESFEDRRESLLSLNNERITTHELEDSIGPAAVRKDCDAIICTPETLGNCQLINEKRVANGLLPLEIIEVPYINDEIGGVISSSRIRAGIIDRFGKPWITDEQRSQVHHYHSSLDDELKNPVGTLYEGPEDSTEIAVSAAIENIAPGAIIAVGDISVASLLDIGITPDIALIDGYTKRTELIDKIELSHFDVILNCKNPAGQINPSLIDTIDLAMRNDESTCINVDGEEDLAPLIIHLFAPIGTNVIYGQPSKGVVLQITDENVKLRCRELLSRFEV